MYCVKKIQDDLFWVGGSDRRLALFENAFPIPRGVSYNSYLLLDEKTVLFDTVDGAILDNFCENIAHVLDGRDLDYVFVHHMEPDHSSSLERVLRKYPNAKIVTNAKTVTYIKQFFDFENIDEKIVVVKEGETFSTGKHNFAFVLAPMVHWPEVMVSFDTTTGTLFSADAFGTFGAMNGNIFADQVDFEKEWLDDARRYYTNIVGKYGPQVKSLLEKASTLDIKMICPLHGPILKDNLGYYIDKYQIWSSYQSEDEGVLVASASIHGNTKEVALKVVDLLKEKGVKVAFTDLTRDDIAEAVEDAFRYSKMILAGATYDGGVFSPMEDFLHRLQHKGYQNKTVGLIENGSWAPLANKVMKEMLTPMKNVTICENTVTIKSTYKDENQEAINQLVEEICH